MEFGFGLEYEPYREVISAIYTKLLEVFKKHNIEPPEWIDFMVMSIYNTLIEEGYLDEQRIEEEVERAVLTYIMVVSERKAIEKELRERREQEHECE